MKTDVDASGIDGDESSGAQPALVRKLKAQLLGGSLTLLAGSGLVGVTNLAYNVVTARLLGPAGFAHATAVYTMLMLMSCVTLSFQVVTAKYVARSASAEERGTVFASLHRRSWFAGIAIGLLIFLFRQPLTIYLNLPDPALISLLGLGTAFYIPLGVRRGYIQGIHAFRPLAMSFILEGLVRLGGAYLLIELGMGVKGAVLASALAVCVCYFAAIPSPGLTSLGTHGISISFREGLQAIVFFSGQTVINNFDIVLVKHFFPPAEAGFYAAVALVGRLVNMCAWSVVHTMFPVSAGTVAEEHDGRPVLFTSLLLVLGILTILIFGLWMIPDFLWKTLFGSQFGLGDYGALAPLLILYAITTGVYSLSAVIMTYEMSRKIANTSWLQLVFSSALVFGVSVLHDTLRQVILVQLILMVVLLAILIIPLLRHRFRSQALHTYNSLRLRRKLGEEEVIAEFLKSEFHHSEFDEYRHQFDRLVKEPDLNDSRENAVRQALLFLRRGAMWRELPGDTIWFEVELSIEDLARIRFFPRAQWRKAANGSFGVVDVVERIRLRLESSAQGEFFDKLRVLGYSLQDDIINRTVLLIGSDAEAPLTILDGNHRLAAVMLSQPGLAWGRFRFICGLSPKMTQCCWYSTNVNTLLRYLRNLVRYLSYDPESDIGRFQEKQL
ncbi:MAG TPA: lipopolysaccharide biosynthesis protein [Terriglobales bacterium]|jgi:O-antigen/teichoic acid export membrane protein|nr:lipopolysaccharide biosynthesis protein [Terriglobales bacterium]